MSRDWKADRDASNRRVRDLQKKYVRQLRGKRPKRRVLRRVGSLLVVVAIVVAALVLPRLLARTETAATDVRTRVEEAIDERTTELVEQVEDELGVELTTSDEEILAEEVDLSFSDWALPLDSIDAERAVRPHHSYPAWDYGTPVGTPVYAMTASVVVSANDDDGDRCGGTVRLTTEKSGAEITYCHLSEVAVGTGDQLVAGELVGFSGGKPGAAGAGRSSGPHLHLQIRLDGQLRCPQAQFVALAQGRQLPVEQLPTDCFYVASGLAGVGQSDDSARNEAWYIWD